MPDEKMIVSGEQEKTFDAFKSLEDIPVAVKSFDYWNLLIQGQVSNGKSWLMGTAASGETPILCLSFDKKDAGLQLHPQRKYIKFVNFLEVTSVQGPAPMPRAFTECMLYVGMLESLKKDGKLDPRIIIALDSLKYCELAALQYAMYDIGRTASAKLKVGGSEILVPQGWDGYKASITYVRNLILRLMALSNLIVIAHERAEEDTTSTAKDKRERLTGQYALDPPRLNELKSLFLNKFRVESTGTNSWRLYTVTNDKFDGGCIFEGASPIMEASLLPLLRHTEKKA